MKTIAVTHLIVRRDGVLCTVCADVLPVHPGESGTPLGTFVYALEKLARDHPPTPHQKIGCP